MSASLNRFLQARLAETNARNLYRRRRVVTGAHGVQAQVDGAEVTLFCSNDYLGLATHPELRAAMAQAAEQQGVGSGASQLITGHNQAHRALEQELADYVQRERALLLSSGYLTNMGVIAALVGPQDAIFSDALNHASLIDGIRLSKAQIQRYAHADMAELTAKLEASNARHRLIVSDAVFSMDGDVADLAALAKIAQAQDAWLMLDDAHGLGVLGPQGRGTVLAASLDAEAAPILTATLGKSIGAAGAFVAGSEALIETLIQSTRSFIFSTAMPPAVAEAARVGLRLSRDEGWRREKLFELIAHFRAGAKSRGLPIGESSTAIQPLILGAEQRALDVSEKLLAQGYLVSAIRPPTVPAGTSRLRITLSAAHSRAQVDALLEAIEQALL